LLTQREVLLRNVKMKKSRESEKSGRKMKRNGMMAKIDNAKMDALEFLKGYAHGALALELAQKLQEAGAAAKETGKKAAVKLTLDIVPVKNMPGRPVQVKALVMNTLPKQETSDQLMFVGATGELVRDDPDQLRFDQLPTGKTFTDKN